MYDTTLGIFFGIALLGSLLAYYFKFRVASVVMGGLLIVFAVEILVSGIQIQTGTNKTQNNTFSIQDYNTTLFTYDKDMNLTAETETENRFYALNSTTTSETNTYNLLGLAESIGITLLMGLFGFLNVIAGLGYF